MEKKFTNEGPGLRIEKFYETLRNMSFLTLGILKSGKIIDSYWWYVAINTGKPAQGVRDTYTFRRQCSFIKY
jgi:hypothetical protein